MEHELSAKGHASDKFMDAKSLVDIAPGADGVIVAGSQVAIYVNKSRPCTVELSGWLLAYLLQS